jgi:hypothetical protein
MKPAAVRRHEPPPHATPEVTSVSTLAPSAEKVLLTDFCNRPTSRAPATDRSIPGVFGPLSRSAHIQRSCLRRTRRGVSHLTVRSALRSNSRSRFPPIRRFAGVPESWWAPISASPRRDAPRSAALSSAGEECASTSDAPCRDDLHAFRDEPLSRPAQPTLHPPPEPPLFKAPSRALLPCDPRRLPSTSARSTRRPLSENDESRTRARHRSWGFAALQSGFRRSFAASLRRGGG